MTELDVLNQMLGTLGEAPLQDADDEHPFLPAAKRRLDATSELEQATGWWFNRETVTLQPDPDTGFIYVPTDALSVNEFTIGTLVQRGRRLYNTAETTYVVGVPVACNIVRKVAFEDLPRNMQTLVAAASVRKFNLDYDGDEHKLGESKLQEMQARAAVGAEEIRAIKANLLTRPSTAATLNRIAGASSRRRVI